MDSKKINFLSTADYNRLTDEQRDAYIKRIMDVMCPDDDLDEPMSDDEEVLDFSAVVLSDAEETFESWQCSIDDVPDIESEVDEDEEEVPVVVREEKYVARDGTEWNKTPVLARQALRQNIIRERCEPASETEMLTAVETFQCFFDLKMMDIIMRHTNKKAEKYIMK